jgi:hypothetical protein
MPKINLTNKPTSEQVRIVRDYLKRRSQHKEQGEIRLTQVVKRFKLKSLITDKDKSAHFRKILRLAMKEDDNSNNGKESAEISNNKD